jgi:hypothetical protein
MMTGDTIDESTPYLERLADTLVNGTIHREWVVSLGRREAISRLAHVFCEVMLRLKHAGLAQDTGCPLPLTQENLDEATGLSLVHVNRTLQDLEGKISSASDMAAHHP